ncbi:uncharacterized protein PRCAT00001754001 [Priceomyces carsonii]|uniref:uncharacterized protein n=1 Tax=Priceomyces carsonii TaxID=28549 RepID=UPI002EDA1F04|nr:unnamed protein product [Priceomyces carsonii]
MLLNDMTCSTDTNWISANVLLSTLNSENSEEFANCIIGLIAESETIAQKINDKIIRNEDFTSCNLIIEIIGKLNNLTSFNLIENGKDVRIAHHEFPKDFASGLLSVIRYLSEINKTFNNLIQLSSIRCHGLRSWNNDFEKDHLAFFQISRNILIYWYTVEPFKLSPLFLSLRNLSMVEVVEKNTAKFNFLNQEGAYWDPINFRKVTTHDIKFEVRIRKTESFNHFVSIMRTKLLEKECRTVAVQSPICVGILTGRKLSRNVPTHADSSKARYNIQENSKSSQSKLVDTKVSKDFGIREKKPSSNQTSRKKFPRSIKKTKKNKILFQNSEHPGTDLKVSSNVQKSVEISPNGIAARMKNESRKYGKKAHLKSTKRDIWELSSSAPPTPLPETPDKLANNTRAAKFTLQSSIENRYHESISKSIVSDSQVSPTPLRDKRAPEFDDSNYYSKASCYGDNDQESLIRGKRRKSIYYADSSSIPTKTNGYVRSNIFGLEPNIKDQRNMSLEHDKKTNKDFEKTNETHRDNLTAISENTLMEDTFDLTDSTSQSLNHTTLPSEENVTASTTFISSNLSKGDDLTTDNPYTLVKKGFDLFQDQIMRRMEHLESFVCKQERIFRNNFESELQKIEKRYEQIEKGFHKTNSKNAYKH